MSGAYAKEFEKWLESNKGENVNNAGDNLGLAHAGDSDDEVDNLSGRASVSSLESRGIGGETAPILSDDDVNNTEFDDEVLNGVRSNHNYEEPPILESMVIDEAPFSCFKTTDKGISHKQILSSVYQDQKNLDRLDRQKSEDRQKCEHRQKSEQDKEGTILKDHVKKGNDEFMFSKQSGNIFDKFSSISQAGEDLPPPLIPSPEAMLTDVHSPDGVNDECVSAKLPDSPDFCAMEADSTSEMCKSSSDDHYGKNDKVTMVNRQGDVSIECDSTCMLGGSPNVLSPGVVSNADLEDSGNQSDSQAILHGSPSECSDEPGPLSGLNDVPLAQSSKTVSIVSKEENDGIKSDSWDKECPTLEAAVRMEEKKDSDIHPNAPVEEPPVLSVISPESYQTLRQKRHTIDTVENINSSAKRKYNLSASCNRSEKPTDIDSLEPPNLSRQSVPDDIASTRDIGSKSRKSSIRKHVSSSRKSHHSKSKHRFRSKSLVDLSKFVKSTSQLSHLQSQMHKLVILLFPQIKSDLEAMSPESIQFENVLTSLVGSLQNTVDDASFHSVSSHFKTSNMIISGSSGNLSESASNSIQSYGLVKDNLLSPNSSSQTASNNHMETNLISSGHSTGFHQSSGLSQETGSKKDVTSGDLTVPDLSQISLTAEKEQILRFQPSVIIKANVCEALKYFSRLACYVLQLLLPDLSINLFDSLGDSHHDLLSLIESVILLNSG